MNAAREASSIAKSKLGANASVAAGRSAAIRLLVGHDSANPNFELLKSAWPVRRSLS